MVKKTKYNPEGKNSYDYHGDLDDEKAFLEIAKKTFGRQVAGAFMVAWNNEGTGITVANANKGDILEKFEEAIRSMENV